MLFLNSLCAASLLAFSLKSLRLKLYTNFVFQKKIRYLPFHGWRVPGKWPCHPDAGCHCRHPPTIPTPRNAVPSAGTKAARFTGVPVAYSLLRQAGSVRVGGGVTGRSHVPVSTCSHHLRLMPTHAHRPALTHPPQSREQVWDPSSMRTGFFLFEAQVPFVFLS